MPPSLPPRIDPFYGLPTPMLFAHRGGCLEAPESTERAFRYARDVVRADVFELDVNRTRDGGLVVWHGPALDCVRIAGIPDDPAIRSAGRRNITDFAWDEIDGRAWVADPLPRPDLSAVPREPDRRVLRFDEFLRLFPDVPKNIEMKGALGDGDGVRAFLRTLDENRGERPIVVTSAGEDLLRRFAALQTGRGADSRYPLSISERGHVRVLLGAWTPFIAMPPMRERSFQTTWWPGIASARAVRTVREAGGATYVFLSAFAPFPALDGDPAKLTADAVGKVLDRGVDGVMSDRPRLVRPLVDAWIRDVSGEK